MHFSLKHHFCKSMSIDMDTITLSSKLVLLETSILFKKKLGCVALSSMKSCKFEKIGYNINVMRQTACLVVNPIKVNSFAYLFNCMTVGRTSDCKTVPS